MTDYLSFDIEIYNDLPDGYNIDFSSITPSVGAFCTDMDDVKFYYDDPFMTKETAQKLVTKMLEKYHDGFVPFTWNGTSFDWRILSFYSDMVEECSELCLNGIDGMFLVVARKGFMLSLNKALIGANIQEKLHVVALNDGTELTTMSGKTAPLLWRNKEFSAVKDYLRVDVEAPLKLAKHIEHTGCIKWTSNSRKPMRLKTEMLTVKEALKLPLPDTSWQENPKLREDFYSWIPMEILKSEGVIE